jgi:uncharacterized protein YcnI
VGTLRLSPGPAALAVLGAAATIVLAAAAPAAADATVAPAEGVRGEGVRLTFRITNDSDTASVTAVRLELPAGAPIAEVYPLSVPDWAPRTTMRPLGRTLTGLHGTRVTETAASIVWTPVKGRAIRPHASAELPVAIGPLPEADRLVFTLVQTYSDGTTKRSTTARDDVALTLVAPTGSAAPHGHDAAAPGALRNTPPSAAGGGPTGWAVAGWVCAALAGAAALATVLRGRARRRPDGAGAATDSPAPGAATEVPTATTATGAPAADNTPAATTPAGTPATGTSTGRWAYREAG